MEIYIYIYLVFLLFSLCVTSIYNTAFSCFRCSLFYENVETYGSLMSDLFAQASVFAFLHRFYFSATRNKILAFTCRALVRKPISLSLTSSRRAAAVLPILSAIEVNALAWFRSMNNAEDNNVRWLMTHGGYAENILHRYYNIYIHDNHAPIFLHIDTSLIDER